MRKLLFILLLTPLISFAQTPIAFSGVTSVDSATKDELFVRARQWFNKTFVSAKEVLQISDKESGELSGKGLTKLTGVYKYMGTHKADFDTRFAVNVWVKDGKYKYEIKDFYAEFSGKSGYDIGLLTDAENCPAKWSMSPQRMMNEIWVSLKEQAATKAKALAFSLESAMNKKGSADW